MSNIFLNVIFLVICTFVIGVFVAYIIKFMLYIMDKLDYYSSFKNGYFKVLFRAISIKKCHYKKLFNTIKSDDLLFNYYENKTIVQTTENNKTTNDLINHYYGR